MEIIATQTETGTIRIPQQEKKSTTMPQSTTMTMTTTKTIIMSQPKTKTKMQFWPAGNREKEGGGEEGQEPAARVKVCVDRLERVWNIN